MEFENFDDLVVSSKTYTIQPNFKISLNDLFDMIPITEYFITEKRRGRKKKGYEQETNNNIPYGSFISVKYKNKLKGIDLKKRNTLKENISSMRNSMSIDIILDKRINFKIYCNGTFQLTGCKTYYHAYKCVEIVWNIIKDKSSVYTMSVEGQDPKAVIIPAMRNVNFSLGFTVDREKMMSEKKRIDSAYCYLEISCTYTGLTLKMPLDKDIRDIETYSIVYSRDLDTWEISKTKYGEYLDTLSDKVLSEKLKQKRYNTFIIFYSGTTIMTGITRECMKDAYNNFISLIKNNYSNFAERLDSEGVISDGLSDSASDKN